jgi:hypothetical protein
VFLEGAKWIGFRRESPPRLTLNFDACTRPECLLRGEVQLRHLFGLFVREVLSSRCGFARSCVRGPTKEPVSKSETRRIFTRARAGQADGKETDRKDSCEKGGEKSARESGSQSSSYAPQCACGETAVAKKSPAATVPARPKPAPADRQLLLQLPFRPKFSWRSLMSSSLGC